jgi:predicted DNA-binding antitoxin AbrB/MazE fold protein
MSTTELTVTAIFENGVLRPDQPLPLAPRQRVTLVVQIAETAGPWPENVAEVYREIAEEDRRVAAAMFPGVRQTWPASERNCSGTSFTQ